MDKIKQMRKHILKNQTHLTLEMTFVKNTSSAFKFNNYYN